jgi:hypothetical protein
MIIALVDNDDLRRCDLGFEQSCYAPHKGIRAVHRTNRSGNVSRFPAPDAHFLRVDKVLLVAGASGLHVQLLSRRTKCLRL